MAKFQITFTDLYVSEIEADSKEMAKRIWTEESMEGDQFIKTEIISVEEIK